MKNRGIVQGLAWTLATACMVSTFTPMQAMANSNTNFDMRKKVIGTAGIMTTSTNVNMTVTRAEFARMLVLASSYRNVLTYSSNISVFADVTSGNEYASAIRIAAEQGWMTGYLGGNFKPDQDITLNEAVRGVLYALGYTSVDFDGDQYNKRMAMYGSLDLDDNIGEKNATDSMTREDCIDLFYNMLKCNKAGSNTAYVTVLGGELGSDGEVNALTLADNSLKGPKLCTTLSELDSAIPFSMSDVNFFLNGSASTYDLIRQACDGSGFIVVYYSSVAKSVWAYSSDINSSDEDAENGVHVVRGEVTNIYYQSSSTLTPSSVVIDDGDDKYYLTSSDMQFAFSIYGSVQVGDEVALIYEASTDSDGNIKKTVTDYIED